jgi:hypothetical protein
LNECICETLLDRELALTRVGGDAELLKEIASLFLEDYPLSLAELRDALARGDATKVERTAHGLKGSVSISARSRRWKRHAISRVSGRAHQLAEVGQVLNTLELALAALRPELNRCKIVPTRQIQAGRNAMNRREFLSIAAAGAALAPQSLTAADPTFDADFGTALAAAEAIRKKKIFFGRATTHCFERIAKYDRPLNSMVVQLRERAMARAKQGGCDSRAWRGGRARCTVFPSR